jgi:hypothetical protein
MMAALKKTKMPFLFFYSDTETPGYHAGRKGAMDQKRVQPLLTKKNI